MTPEPEVRALSATPAKGLVRKLAEKYGVEPTKFLSTLKSTAFRQKENAPPVTNEQMMMLLVVADQHGLNPFLKEIYAFPDKQAGIVPIVGVDGWSRILNSHPEFNGMEFRESSEWVQLEDAKACPDWIECVIYRKDREHPIVIREYLDECYRPPFKRGDYTKPGPWQTHTKRFLRHKTMIQAARIAFGFAGIYDQDEGERIIEGQIVEDDGSAPTVSAADINANLRKEPAATKREAAPTRTVEAEDVTDSVIETEPGPEVVDEQGSNAELVQTFLNIIDGAKSTADLEETMADVDALHGQDRRKVTIAYKRRQAQLQREEAVVQADQETGEIPLEDPGPAF